jgi:ketosteroid isomerase-like protein
MNPTDVDAILQADQARYKAMIEADVTALDSLLAEDPSYTHSSAVTDGKKHYLAAVASGRFRYMDVDLKDVDVRPQGDSAFMHGRAVVHAVVDGVERRLDNRFLSVWTHKAGHWQMAAWAAFAWSGVHAPVESRTPGPIANDETSFASTARANSTTPFHWARVSTPLNPAGGVAGGGASESWKYTVFAHVPLTRK